MGCCSNYLFNQIILGQGVPADSGPACTVFCLINNYVGGEVVVSWVIGGNTHNAGVVVYTDQITISALLDGAFNLNGCLATLSGYNIGGVTGTDQTYAFGSVDDISVAPPDTCIAEQQLGDLNGTFIAMECAQVSVAAVFESGRANMTQVESMTVNDFTFYFATNTFDQTAAVGTQIKAKLEDVWGLTVTSVTVTLNVNEVTITIVSNGTVQSLTWDGFTTGNKPFV